MTGRETPERAAAGLSLVSNPDTFAAGHVLSEADLNGETRADDRARSGQVLVPDPDEEQLAGILIRMWWLASGRRLDRDVRPCELSPNEPISFWADDFAPVSGRHARGSERTKVAA